MSKVAMALSVLAVFGLFALTAQAEGELIKWGPSVHKNVQIKKRVTTGLEVREHRPAKKVIIKKQDRD
jgi:hypothetical protein